MNITKTGISTTELQHLVARASTLHERLDSSIFAPSSESMDESRLQSRLDAWCQAAAKGDRDRFHRLLAWQGMDLEDAKRLLLPVQVQPNASLPAWADLLKVVLDIAPSTIPARLGSPQLPHRFLDAKNPLPFEEIFTPFVLIAQQQLASQVGDRTHRLTDQAHATLERSLLGRLIDTASHAIDRAFAKWRVKQQSSFSRLLNTLQETPGNSLYLTFVQTMLQGKLVSFLQEYPVLARLLATQTLLWIQNQTEFLHHLNADWDAIATTLAAGQELEQVTAIKPALSDPHRGGRTVMILEFGSDVRVVYKPKQLGIEYTYNQLLDWLNEQGSPLPLKVLQIIYRETHIWVEYVEPLPCKTMEQLERFYRRAGMLLCLMYVLEATDCHFENLIASGEHLILIDTETLLHHRFAAESVENAQSAHHLAIHEMGNSVMRTMLLPAWEMDEQEGSAYDYSGLGSHAQWNRTYKGLQWYQVNTDQMTLRLQELSLPTPKDNVPTLNGELANLQDWVESVVTGFEQMYRFLLSQRAALQAEGSPLWQMGEQPVRLVFRRTNTYYKLLKKLRLPEYLRDGIDRSLELELLKRAMLESDEQPLFWPVMQAEQQQMEQLDIPFFTVPANRDVLEVSGHQIKGFLSEPSFQTVLERVRSLNETDLNLQLQFIHASLGLRTLAGHGGQTLTSQDASPTAAEGTVLDESDFLAEAIAIAQRLQDRAICAPDGSVTWLAPQFAIQTERFQLQPTDNGLYDGRLGIALFLAAVERVTQTGQFRSLCLRSLQEFRQLQSHEFWNSGMANGLGGAVYSLTQISQLLNDDALLTDAVTVAHQFTPEMIERDRAFDIISGAAGCLLGLLKLYQATQDAAVLRAALVCGQHLLNQSTPMDQGIAWKTLSGRPLTGFSHGTAGIAYALLHLAHLSGRAEFHAAALDAIAYEQNLFIPELGNWPDLRDFSSLIRATSQETEEVKMPPMSSWCHGAAGIGLARLGGLDWFAPDNVHHDIQTAIQTTSRLLTLTATVEQLCCGKMGQIELLIAASDRLSQPTLLTDARFHASQIVHRANQQGGYKLEPALPSGIYVPSFFRGEAGVGYTLLRLIAPNHLPSVLLFV